MNVYCEVIDCIHNTKKACMITDTLFIERRGHCVNRKIKKD